MQKNKIIKRRKTIQVIFSKSDRGREHLGINKGYF